MKTMSNGKITDKFLKAALKDCIVREQIFHTYLMETESIINSRPLTLVTNDSNDIEFLTPNHFLVAEHLQIKNLLQRQKRTQTCVQSRKQHKLWRTHFAKKWIKEYLPSLTERHIYEI